MSKPKKSEFKASESEKVNAAVAKADKDYFRQNYLPKQKEFLERSFNQESGLMSVGEGRAQADTMQALTMNPNRQAVAAVDSQADLAAAAAAQQLQGTAQGLAGARQDQVAGIKSANQMASQTAAGLSTASKIATTDITNHNLALTLTETTADINSAVNMSWANQAQYIGNYEFDKYNIRFIKH